MSTPENRDGIVGKSASNNWLEVEGTRKQVFVTDVRPKDTVRSTFLVRQKEVMQSKNGKPYLAMTLADKTGTLDARVWEDVESLAAQFTEGDVVAVSGRAHQFQNRLQLVVEHLVMVPIDEQELAEYLPTSGADVERLYQELVEVFQGLSCPWTKQVGLALLEDPEIARRYKRCPAAKTIHHAFLGGLLVHSMQLIKLVDAVLPYYPDLDRSLLIFGAAFHDFGKIYELSYDSAFGYTDEGRLVGHIAVGTVLVDRKIQAIPNFPQAIEYQLKHLVLSHHGRLEYGSPKRPHTIEAQLLHHLDDMDSKIQSIQEHMKADRTGNRWTGHHRAYDNYYYKPDSLVTR